METESPIVRPRPFAWAVTPVQGHVYLVPDDLAEQHLRDAGYSEATRVNLTRLYRARDVNPMFTQEVADTEVLYDIAR